MKQTAGARKSPDACDMQATKGQKINAQGAHPKAVC